MFLEQMLGIQQSMHNILLLLVAASRLQASSGDTESRNLGSDTVAHVLRKLRNEIG